MSDESRLHQLGYAQELRRSLGFLGSFGIAFCYISPVVGVYTLFGYGLSTGGPAFVWGLVPVVAGQLLVVLVFSEVAAAYPLSGALYQWARRLVGPRYGWFVGWTYGWALVLTIAAVDAGAAPYLASLCGLPPTRTVLVALAAGLLLAHSAFNYFGIRATRLITSLGVVVEVAATVVIAGALLFTGLRQPLAVLVDRSLVPSPALGSLLASTLAMAWVFYGFESAADVAEEVIDPERQVPRAMLGSLLGAAAVTAVVVIALVLGAPDLRAAAADPAQTIPLILGAHFGPEGRSLILALVLAAYLSCAAAVQVAAARLVFSYARDGMLPGSGWLRAVSGHQVPANAIVFTAAIGLLATTATGLTAGGLDLNALLGAYAVLGIYLSFQAILWARLLAGRRGFTPAPGFSLGRAGTPIALLALTYNLAMVVNLGWPRPADALAGWLPLAAALAIVGVGALLALGRS